MRNILLSAIVALTFTACHKSTTTPTYNVTGNNWYQAGDTSLYLSFSPDTLYVHHPALVPNPSPVPYTRQLNTITLNYTTLTTTLTILADTIFWTNNTTARFYRKY